MAGEKAAEEAENVHLITAGPGPKDQANFFLRGLPG